MSEKPMAAPSAEFMSAVCDGGTPVATCGFCGVTTFGDGYGMDEGELGAWKAKAAANPKNYRQDDLSSSVGVGELAGHIVVFGCPCNGMTRYEEFIWNHRKIIMEYLRTRAKKDLAEAVANSTALDWEAK